MSNTGDRMFKSIFLAGYFLFAFYLFAPILWRSWKTGVWIARNNEWTRTRNPKLYWSGMTFGVFNIAAPLFLVIMQIRYGVH